MPDSQFDAAPDSLRPVRVLRASDAFRWPGGKRAAMIFNIAFEAWSDGVAPPIGPMGNVLKPGHFDTNALSWADYGVNRGAWRLAQMAEAAGVRASVMVNGVAAERAPATVRAMADAGHDVYAHSWGMDIVPIYLDEAEERANIERTAQSLAEAAGERPLGWISPRVTASHITSALLAEAGYLWHGDCNDDDLPWIAEFADGAGGVNPLVMIPFTMDVNDLPHCVRYGGAPGALVDRFEEALNGAIDTANGPFLLDVTAHAHVLGRPAAAWAFAEMLDIAIENKDIWIATRREIADYALDNASVMFA